MIQTIIFLIILIIVGFLILRFLIRQNRKVKLNNWTLFEGELGARKTAVCTRKSVNLWRGRIVFNSLNLPLNIVLNGFLFIIPIVNIIYILIIIRTKKLLKIKKRCEDVYSTYPIYLSFPFGLYKKKWGFTYAINADVLDWKFKVTEDCIVILDEIGYIFPSELKKTDPKITFCMTWFRHATNATVICATQSMSEVNVTFRRKCNKVYQLSHGQRCLMPFGLWFTKVQVREIIISEDVNNIYQDNIETRLENWYTFKYPVKHFENRYGKKLYNLTQEQITKVSLNYQRLFEYLNMNNGEKWKSLSYDI